MVGASNFINNGYSFILIMVLRLYSNQLSSIDVNIFQGLSKLQWLYLDNNQLSSIGANTFQGLSNLIEML